MTATVQVLDPFRRFGGLSAPVFHWIPTGVRVWLGARGRGGLVLAAAGTVAIWPVVTAWSAASLVLQLMILVVRGGGN